MISPVANGIVAPDVRAGLTADHHGPSASRDGADRITGLRKARGQETMAPPGEGTGKVSRRRHVLIRCGVGGCWRLKDQAWIRSLLTKRIHDQGRSARTFLINLIVATERR